MSKRTVQSFYHAQLDTPLGQVGLSATPLGLSGLHFLDQRDCPAHFHRGMAADTQRIYDPTAGQSGEQPLRALKAYLPDDSLPGLDRATPQPLPGAVEYLSINEPASCPAQVQALFKDAAQQLRLYFEGQLRTFDLPLDLHGTPFQVNVWQAMTTLACGELTSYGELATQSGAGAAAVRAVGVAVGANPVSIIVPCHRVVARNRQLTGYGGGLHRKVQLLRLEGIVVH